MKRAFLKTLITIALALGIWCFFYVSMEGESLSFGGTCLVVAFCAVIVHFGQLLYAWFYKKIMREHRARVSGR